MRAVKVPCLEGGRIGPSMESCINCDGPISMVPCLHQGNIYIKRKLQVWRDQKCIPLIGAITQSHCDSHQSTPSRGKKYRADQGNIYTKRKLRVWSDQKCIPLVGAITPLTCAGRQNTLSRGRQERSQYRKLHKL